MSTATKTIIATGASSGLGFEVVKQLFTSPSQHSYTFILGVRDIAKTRTAYNQLEFDRTRHTVTLVPLDLANLKTTRTFAEQALKHLGSNPLDYLLLNAAISNSAGTDTPGPHGSRWSETYLVNHLSQHYLTHLLRSKLTSSESHSRIIFVSSAAFREVADPAVFDNDLLAGSETPGRTLYGETKFVHLLGAHWWRRQLAGQCTVVAVSPGLVPGTNIASGMGLELSMAWPGARPVPDGAASIISAFTRDDFPDDQDQIFLTSWGEWWGKDVLEKTLDKNLQDKWCPRREEIEQEEGIYE